MELDGGLKDTSIRENLRSELELVNLFMLKIVFVERIVEFIGSLSEEG